MNAVCPTCGQPTSSGVGERLTTAELEALSAWWHMGSTRAAADLLSRAERTVINQLYSARNRNNVHTTSELVHLYMGRLRTMSELVTSHKSSRRKAA